MNHYVIIVLSQVSISFSLTHIKKIVNASKAHMYKVDKKINIFPFFFFFDG